MTMLRRAIRLSIDSEPPLSETEIHHLEGFVQEIGIDNAAAIEAVRGLPDKLVDHAVRFEHPIRLVPDHAVVNTVTADDQAQVRVAAIEQLKEILEHALPLLAIGADVTDMDVGINPDSFHVRLLLSVSPGSIGVSVGET